MNHLVWLILDSCRYDSFQAAKTPNFDRLGNVERRFSYATWTAPSHYAFLMGLTPHTSPAGVFASEVYIEEFQLWTRRLGVEGLEFSEFLPELSLPCKLSKIGYHTTARVSLPVLNPKTLLSRYFHNYRLMEGHNEFHLMVEEVELSGEDPRFLFFNLGETHYPYRLQDDSLPHISGVHGVFKKMDQFVLHPEDEGLYTSKNFFTHPEMQRLHQAQIRAVEHIDTLFGKLLEKCPPHTYFIVCADHGELFGEEGFFGHGPIVHPKVQEVPYLEGLRP